MSPAEMLCDAAQARQNRFRSLEELADVFRYLNRFRRLRKGVAELIARSVLRFDPARGDWQLCCHGQIEANLYTEVAELPIWRKPGPPARAFMIVGSDPEPEDAWMTAACCKARHSASTTPSCPIPATCSSGSPNGATPCSANSSPTLGSAPDRISRDTYLVCSPLALPTCGIDLGQSSHAKASRGVSAGPWAQLGLWHRKDGRRVGRIRR